MLWLVIPSEIPLGTIRLVWAKSPTKSIRSLCNCLHHRVSSFLSLLWRKDYSIEVPASSQHAFLCLIAVACFGQHRFFNWSTRSQKTNMGSRTFIGVTTTTLHESRQVTVWNFNNPWLAVEKLKTQEQVCSSIPTHILHPDLPQRCSTTCNSQD